ncbi:Polysaccharide export protein [uncultured Desulfobacterium sp.]|uniref:Polysaccharide export protein n=1 Tax=uncultured Desulfobacterium sp. TaxID=201089 RepID=A0A445MUW3_9BACT|nr:Polysaccharide export protein [uncultured Desulfobacterium sp.]
MINGFKPHIGMHLDKENQVKTKLIYTMFILFFFTICTIAQAAEGSYRIGPGDILEISVWKDENLRRQIVVPPDCVISFPLIGSIEVSGLTAPELKNAIAERLTEYIPDPTVTVLFLQVNSSKAYVIGKVNKPGEFPVSMDTNVMQLLSMAGGLNAFASADKILILRQQDKNTVEIPFNYKQVEKGDKLEQNILIQRGDVVVVP